MSTQESVIIADRTHEVRYYPNAMTSQGARGLYVWRGAFEDRMLPVRAGFAWDVLHKVYATASPAVAYRLAPRLDELKGFVRKLEMSWASESDLEVPFPPGVVAHPYQLAGIEYVMDMPAALLADAMGLGKSLQFIGLANLKGYRRMLVVCPAHLRVNLAREIKKFGINNPQAVIFDTKKRQFNPGDSPAYLIVSYEAATRYTEVLRSLGPFDLMVVDEAHRLKGQTAKRSKALLGTAFQEPLTTAAQQVLFLTGSPLPNRPAEIWPILRSCAAHVIKDCLGFESFAERFGYVEVDEDGVTARGSKNEIELGLRLRGQFMCRRLKKDVLPQLPQKQYEMVVFPADGATRKVLQKEKPFSVSEIITNGVPAGSPLAEVRHEMGLAKLPLAVEFIEGLLDDGLKKAVLFAHHRDVVQGLADGLKRFNPAVVIGGLTDRARQAAVDGFQNDPRVRAIILNLEAGSTGLTLTAADTLIRVEADWVPSTNDQAEDRICRIGQEADSLRIMDLVVEGSLDARVLGCSARKGNDVTKVLDNVRA